MVALESLTGGTPCSKDKIPEDYQRAVLEELVLPYKQQILDAEDRVKAITDAAFEIIDQHVASLVDQSGEHFKGNRLFLLGGIFINTCPEHHDYMDVRSFRVVGE